MINLDSLVDELLYGKVDLKEKTSFFDRVGQGVRNVFRRREIDKEINDELEAQRQKVIAIGKSAETFLNSSFYKQFIDTYVRSSIRNGLQHLFMDYESLSEAQMKAELAGIMKCLRLVASIKLKAIQGEQEKEKIKEV